MKTEWKAVLSTRFVNAPLPLCFRVSDGLVSNNLVFRYNTLKAWDGISKDPNDAEEGTFCLCTFWAVEASARLGMFRGRTAYLEKSRLMFEQVRSPMRCVHT